MLHKKRFSRFQGFCLGLAKRLIPKGAAHLFFFDIPTAGDTITVGNMVATFTPIDPQIIERIQDLQARLFELGRISPLSMITVHDPVAFGKWLYRHGVQEAITQPSSVAAYMGIDIRRNRFLPKDTAAMIDRAGNVMQIFKYN